MRCPASSSVTSGPALVSDRVRVGADKGVDAARDGQRPGGIEPAGEPIPFLAVPEERAGGREDTEDPAAISTIGQCR